MIRVRLGFCCLNAAFRWSFVNQHRHLYKAASVCLQTALGYFVLLHLAEMHVIATRDTGSSEESSYSFICRNGLLRDVAMETLVGLGKYATLYTLKCRRVCSFSGCCFRLLMLFLYLSSTLTKVAHCGWHCFQGSCFSIYLHCATNGVPVYIDFDLARSSRNNQARWPRLFTPEPWLMQYYLPSFNPLRGSRCLHLVMCGHHFLADH